MNIRGYLLLSRLFREFQLTVAGVLLFIFGLFIPAEAVGWLYRRFPRLRQVLL